MSKLSKNLISSPSISAQRKMIRSQHWKKQAMLDKSIAERTDVFIEQKNTSIIVLKNTNQARAFSAIVNSKGVIIIK